MVRPSYQPGDFSFISAEVTRDLLARAYVVVNDGGEENWKFFDRDPPVDKGYMWWGDAECERIIDLVYAKCQCSGAQAGYIMRSMQNIRKLGWRNFVDQWPKK